MPFRVPSADRTPADDALAARGLPERCFVRSPGELVWEAVRGRLGLVPCPSLPWTEASAANARAGLVDAQRHAMLMGATYGWDVAAADPATYAGGAWRIAWRGGAPGFELPAPSAPDQQRRVDAAMALVEHRLPFGTLERSRDAYERLRIVEEGWLASVARELTGAESRAAA